METIDDNPGYPLVDVRWFTPNNTLSACISMCRSRNLKCVSDKVVPMPRSDEWWQESREFCAGIERAIYDAGI